MSQNSSELQQQKILVVDDHELILDGTLNVLKQQYPEAEILTAQTAQEVIKQVENIQPNLVVMDLSIPEKPGMTSQTDTGIQLLFALMKQYSTLNLMVQSSHVKALVRLKHEIDAHEGGFTIADKSISEHEMLARVNWALLGITHTKDLKIAIELKPDWLKVLELANEGLTDKAIAKQMNMSERMVRHYWTKVQDVLGIYPEEDKNLRILTLNKAREEGLID